SDERLSEDTRGNLRPLVEALARDEWPAGVKPVELPGRTPVPGRDLFDVLEVMRENIDLAGKPVPGEPDDTASRLIRRQADLYYQGEVHEQLVFADGRPTKLAMAEKVCLKLLHTGYRPEVKDQKEARNNRILLNEEAQGGSTQLKDYYLAKLHLERREWMPALEAAWRCLKDARPVHYKDAPYCIMCESARELEKEALAQAGLNLKEGESLPPPQPEETELMQKIRRLRQYVDNVIRAAINEFPDYPDAYYYRGLRRWHGGDPAGGQADLQKARELAETFPDRYPEEFFNFEKALPDLYRDLEAIAKEVPAGEANSDSQEERWQFYVARADTLGGRALRSQLSASGDFYKILEETSPEEQQKAEGARGLLLPFLEITRENQAAFLPKVALALQRARGFRRIVLMLREPLPEVLSLLSRHQKQGLPCTAVCAVAGQLFGGQRPEDPSGLPEELLDRLMERADSASPRKRLLLPCREQEDLHLVFVEDLARATIFVLKKDTGLLPLVVEGEGESYGHLAALAREAAGFEGRLQFGKGRLPKTEAIPDNLRSVKGARSCSLKEALAFLARKRRHKGKLFLSACLIMRDSEADIERCLKSLYQADEIIVVDTGSVDRSVEIAKKYTDKVYHFEWIDDFAAAKNFALDQAQGDWIVFPDSDEFFTEESAAGLHRLAEDYDGPGIERQLLVRRLEMDKKLQPLGSEGAACRLFSAGVRFQGAIHELMVTPDGQHPAAGMVPRERCLLNHTGYDPDMVQDKLDRNAKILRHAHEVGEDVPLQHYCMGKTYMAEENYEKARAEMQLALEAEVLPTNYRAEIYRIWYNASKALKDARAMSEAMAAMRRDMPMMPDTYAIEGAELWNQGRKEEAVPLLLRAMELSRDFLRYNRGEVDTVAKDLPATAKAMIGYFEERGDKKTAERVRNILTAL
ncbi:MAG: glycosyltransferase, partial [Selenomonas sp.]|nr:glycosyltransferase [Selenomonas sp.]